MANSINNAVFINGLGASELRRDRDSEPRRSAIANPKGPRPANQHLHKDNNPQSGYQAIPGKICQFALSDHPDQEIDCQQAYP